MNSTQNLDDINDEDVLESMINQTEDEELRRKIRRRQKNIREKRSAAFEAQRQTRLQQSGGEDALTARLRKAEEDKQKKLRDFDEQARTKKEGLGQAEEALRLRQTNADAMKQQKLEQMKEMGKVNSAAYNMGVADVLKKNENVNSSTTVDVQGNTTTTTTKQTNQATNRGAGGTQYTVKTVQTTVSKTSGGGGLSPPVAGGAARGGMVQRNPSAIKEMLLNWCKQQCEGYENVNITNFSSSWNDGMAFCALIHHFYPNAFDFSKLNPKCRRGNFTLAFDMAEKLADIAPLLEVEDMVRMKNPDWKCVFCYVQSFYRRFAMQKNQQPSSPTEA